ncbi:MAG: hypothetical protein JOY99_04095, partial [Sphingomonadaceae bacterium]|nr:hypothetical protein [Sphingomonadaceae bacterium]
MDHLDFITESAAATLLNRLMSIVRTARADLDRDAMAKVLETYGNTDAGIAALNDALGFADGTLEALLQANTRDNGSYIGELLAPFFKAVVALAAAGVGHVANANDEAAKQAATTAVSAFADPYLRDSAIAVAQTAQRMLAASGDVQSRVNQIVRSVGLSPNQAQSLHAMREALIEYLNAPTRTMP